MTWGPIVVGLDGSSESAGAAKLGYRIARAASENCYLVHATPDAWAPFTAVGDPKQAQDTQRLQLAVARHRMCDAVRDTVAPELLEELDVRLGHSAVVLQDVARERGAGLLVLGGKHHSALERWLGGSTSLNVVRTTEIPALITTGAPTAVRRVLVAVDLSEAARPTIQLAMRFARLVGAQLRVLSVLEPLPSLPDVPPVDPTSYYELSQDLLQREIWPLVPTPVEKIVRHGMVVETLLREATDWSADVLVVGSHGKGWAQRILLGSVTERLINDLPTSLLVAPMAVPQAQPHDGAAWAAASMVSSRV
ncbi:MAG TPA: universal stress protein [Gemmatimonadales bacterium]|nr:universal stress protein [Gemmatimonadales bacterium]